MDIVHRQTERIVMPKPSPERKPERRFNPFRFSWQTHLVLIAASVVIWWVAAQRVTEQISHRDGARLDVQFAPGHESLADDWTIVNPMTFSDIRLAGPHNEITRFQAALERRDRGLFKLEITPAMLEGKKPTADHRVELLVPLKNFALAAADVIPSEVKVEHTDPEREIVVTLEKHVRANARFDSSAIKLPKDYDARIDVLADVVVKGRWSLLRPHANETGSILVKLAAFDLDADFTRLTAGLQPAEREAILAKPVERSVRMIPVEGAQFITPTGEKLTALPISITLTPKAEFVELTRVLPLSPLQAPWMTEKRAIITAISVSGTPVRELPVTLRVDPRRSANFSAEHVRLVVDLAGVTPEKLVLEPLSDTNPTLRVGVARRVSVKLSVNEQVLDFRLPTGMAMKGNVYYEADVTIQWSE